MVCWLVRPLVHFCENVTFKLSNGKKKPTFLPTYETIVTVVTVVTVVTLVTVVVTIVTVVTVMTVVTVVTKQICTPKNLNLPKTYLPM